MLKVKNRPGFFCVFALAAAASMPAGGPAKGQSSAGKAPVATVAASQPATTQPSTAEADRGDAMTERFINYYLQMYVKHLKSKDWMARAMAVISLARIDDLRTAEKLIEVMEGDKARIVRVYAWEALHARQDRLTPEQRGKWVEAAFKLADKNCFRGDLRLGLVGLMNAGGPTDRNKRLFMEIFRDTNSLNPADIRTLLAMGDALKKWQSPDLIKGLIKSMSDLNCAYRAELILHKVHSGIRLTYDPKLTRTVGARHAFIRARMKRKQRNLTGKQRWELDMERQRRWVETQRQWVRWFKRANLNEIKPDPDQSNPYRGLSTIMPRGEKITPANIAKWRKDLELKRFRLDALEVVFAVDSTGSMSPAIRWIKHDVIKMMRAFELISHEPRIGVILYRDYGDKYVVGSLPLLGKEKAGALARALRSASAEGGGDIPEAIYEALSAAVRVNWSKSSYAHKMIVLVGDAPPHKNNLGKIKKLVTSTAKRRFKFHCVKVSANYYHENRDKVLADFDKIAEWGNGRSVWTTFEDGYLNPQYNGTVKYCPNSSSRVILREVLKAVLEKGYLDRVDPFVGVLIEYVERPVKERRPSWRELSPVRNDIDYGRIRNDSRNDSRYTKPTYSGPSIKYRGKRVPVRNDVKRRKSRAQ